MNRNKFINITGLATVGLSVLPHLAFSSMQEIFSKDQLIGKGNSDIVGSTYTSKMHREASIALEKMKLKAATENVQIEVISAYRSFQRQKEIFEGKYQKYISEGKTPVEAIDKIIEYSTIPGTSRHHWGTDIDIIDSNAKPRPKNVLQPNLFHGQGPFCKLKEWLDKNANSFGFYEVYTNNANRKGLNMNLGILVMHRFQYQC